MSRNTRGAAIGLTAAAAAVILSACSSGTAPVGADHGRAGTVTAAASSANADPLKASGLAIGVGDAAGASLVTRPTPAQVDARCHGRGNTRSIEITTPSGWHAVLHQGSQTITVDNSTLHYPAEAITTAAGTIEMSQKLAGAGYPLGLTWARPGPGDVEIQLSQDAPASWTTTSPDTQFMMFMHINCPTG